MWMGYWGKHMRLESFKLVKEYQKVTVQYTERSVV